ncbi:hypothetical protein BJF84_08520 [Rhodococcus sp. CUA-806]|nr:hypothetical protein BJF84_08520 [Rhodococcus sp. CUA-806]
MLIGEGAAGLTSDTGLTNGATGSGTRGVLAISNPSLREAVEVLEKAWEVVAAVETSSLDDADHRALMVRMETLTRAMHGTSHTWLTELIESDGLAVLPERTNASRLAGLLLVDPGVAGKRIKIAQRMAPRRAMTGETLEPEYPTTAAAHTAGAIDAAHVNVIDESSAICPQRWITNPRSNPRTCSATSPERSCPSNSASLPRACTRSSTRTAS